MLCEQYASVLKRDPIFYKHLDRIGQLFFGLPPAEGSARNQPGGFLGGLMNTIFSSMAGPGDEDEEDYDDDGVEGDDDGEFFEVPSESAPQPRRPTFDQQNDVD